MLRKNLFTARETGRTHRAQASPGTKAAATSTFQVDGSESVVQHQKYQPVGDLLEMPIPGPRPRLAEAEPLELGPRNLFC